MARTNATDVKLILDTELSDEIVTAFIGDANLIVTHYLGDVNSLLDTQKESIEKWLTAHLLAVSMERQAETEEVRYAKIKYQGKTGLNLDATLYGQQVKLLDTSGTLADGMGMKKITFEAIEAQHVS